MEKNIQQGTDDLHSLESETSHNLLCLWYMLKINRKCSFESHDTASSQYAFWEKESVIDTQYNKQKQSHNSIYWQYKTLHNRLVFSNLHFAQSWFCFKWYCKGFNLD